MHELTILFDHALAEPGYVLDHWHSLEWNLANVSEAEWNQAPPGGHRTIRETALHIGEWFAHYDNAAFGDGSWPWEKGTIRGVRPGRTKDDALHYVCAGHTVLREHLVALTDADLDVPRALPWGDMIETRRIIEIMIQHVLYHVGEINHIRAVLQGNDTWGLTDLGREDKLPPDERT